MATANVDLSPEFASLGGLHWTAIALAAVSGLVHLVLGVQFLPHWMGVLFLLTTGGFAAGIVLVVANVRRPLLYAAGIPFTAGQIGAWIALTRPELLTDPDLTALGPLELIDKTAQVLFIALLVVLLLRERDR